MIKRATSIRLHSDLKREALKACARENRNLGNLIETALMAYLHFKKPNKQAEESAQEVQSQ
jgi:hypothetical protein